MYIWRLGEYETPVAHYTDAVCNTASVGFHSRLTWSPDGQVAGTGGGGGWEGGGGEVTEKVGGGGKEGGGR